MTHKKNTVLEKEYMRLIEKTNYNRENTEKLTETEKHRAKRLERILKTNQAKKVA